MCTYSPQSFLIDKIVVNGETFPSDKLYADEKTLLVNVLDGVRSSIRLCRYVLCDAVLRQEDQYESLEISHSLIKSIRQSRNTTSIVEILLMLTAPPRLGRNYVTGLEQNKQVEAGHNVSFSFPSVDEQRWSETLRSRGLVSPLHIFPTVNADTR